MEELRAQLEQLVTQNDTLARQNAELQGIIRSSTAVSQVEPTVPEKPLATYGVRPKLAPFWLDRPAAASGITADETKYNYVVEQIDRSRLSRDVEDLVTHPPAHGERYGWIKAELIKRFSASEAQRVRLLISGEELGDRKPSVFLRHLHSLAGNLNDEKILRELFLQRLPRTVQAILTAQAELSLEKIAELADKILKVSPISLGTTCAVTPPPPGPVPHK